MKKILFVFMMTLIFFPTPGFSGENYLQIRYGSEFDLDDYNYYFILENNSLENWAVGARIITLNNGFTILNPYFFWKKLNHSQFGIKYSRDSLGSESLGPAFRFINTMGPIFVFFDSTYYIDFKEGNNKLDTWFHISTSNRNGFYYGAEVWYYTFKKGNKILNLRPIKVGYRSKNLPAPFIMLEKKWIDWKKEKSSIYFGLELRF